MAVMNPPEKKLEKCTFVECNDLGIKVIPMSPELRKHLINWIFFPSLNWIFAGYRGSKNPVQTRKKNPDHQNRDFKLKNVKNQVQIALLIKAL